MNTKPDKISINEPTNSQQTIEPLEKSTNAVVGNLQKSTVYDKEIPNLINEFVFQAISKNEKLWRLTKKGPSYDRFFANAVVSAKDTVRAALAVLPQGNWPTLDECIPPGSILNDIDVMFYKGTNFPRELPFFNTLHFISALLLQNGTLIKFQEKTEALPIYPDLWTVALAESGSGKTATQNVISGIMGNCVKMFPDPGSAAKFLELLAEHNGAFWARDEFGEFLKKLGHGPWEDGKDYLLRTYDHSNIESTTKKDGKTFVNDAKLTVFGSTVPAKFREKLSLDSLTDGFAQRLTYVFAPPSGRKRPPVPTFPGKAAITEKWADQRNKLQLHSVYRVDEVAWNAYVEAFDMIMERSGSESIPESFSGRLVTLAFKYATIMHVLLGKTDDVLHADDMVYAARIVALNLRDLRKLLDMYEVTQFGDLANKAKEKVIENAKKKIKTDARTIQQGVRGIDNVVQAWQMLEYLADDPDCAPHLDMTIPRSLKGKYAFAEKKS